VVQITVDVGFLKLTQDNVILLESDGSHEITWHLDAAFALHKDFKSHTGAVMSLGKGIIQSVSTKQKSKSSTEVELISMDNIISKGLWTKLLLKAQDLKIKHNIVLHDNQSPMKLETDGKASSCKRTCHFNINLFYVTDLFDQEELEINCCPADLMIVLCENQIPMKLETNGKASSCKRTRHFNINLFYVTNFFDQEELEINCCPADLMTADYITKPLTGTKFNTFQGGIMNIG
jgi:hypothetical protein